MQIAKALHKQLESYPVPSSIKKSSGKSKVGVIFRDQDELPTSSDLGGGIREALAGSNWLIVICSRALPLSRWCMEEIDTFISLGKGDHILTLLIDGEPSEAFPPQLRFIETDGKRIEIEPLAADIRAANSKQMLKKLRIEKLRLLAPILGVRFDDLKQRAKERRRKRIAVFTAGALLAAVVFGGIYAFQYQKAQSAMHEVNVTKASELLSKAQYYYYNGQRAAAVRSASECLSLQSSLGLDTLSAQSLLYSTIVNYPEKSSFATLNHTGTVNAAGFSADGTLLATISNKNFLTVWNVRTAEVEYTKQLTDLSEPIAYDYPIGQLYCLKFTAKNELVLCMPTTLQDFTDSLGVFKFDSKGNELFSYTSPTFYYNFHTGLSIWDNAGVVVLAAYEGYAVLDLNDGSLITEESVSEYAWTEGYSVGGKYLTLFYFTNKSDSCHLTALVYTADSVKTGKAYKSFSFTVPLDEIDTLVPVDDENVVIAGKNEIYLYNMRSKSRQPVGDFSDTDLKYPILTTCAKPCHFVAGYQDDNISEFAYDPATGQITSTKDFTFGNNPGYIADFVAWADKDASVLSFLLKSKANYGKWVLSDGKYWYRYNVADLDGVVSWVPSEKGTIAAIKKNSNLCYLYDVTVKSDHWSMNDGDSQSIRQPNYLDSTDNIAVCQGFEPGKGYYFSVGSLREGAFSEENRAYVPGTDAAEQSDMFDTKAPYDQVLYGKNEAVLLVSDDSNDYSLLLLDYKDCSFRKLNRFSAEERPSLILINSDIVVVRLSYKSANAYELKTGALAGSNPEGPDYWNLAHHYGRPAKNIAFWGVLVKDLREVHWAYMDFDTGEFVDLKNLRGNDVKVYISEDGYTAYLYNGGLDIAIFDLLTGRITGYIDIDRFDKDNLLDIQYTGGDVLALVNRQNEVLFYDMGTQKELAVFSGLTDNIRSITYNPNNGLAMIMGNTTLEIFDVKNNCRHTGAIMFADRLSGESAHTAYISDDARRFFFVSLEEDSENKTGLWYYFNSSTYRLYTADELLTLAGDYGFVG
jgi:WD40 repeat protein